MASKQKVEIVYKLFFLTIIFIQLNVVASGCSCVPKLTVEKAFLQADLVIQGSVIAIDTVLVSNISGGDSINNKKNIYSTAYLSFKMVVEKNLKQASSLPDTVYVLTGIESASCGYPFQMSVSKDKRKNQHSHYIVYGHRWKENSITIQNQDNESLDGTMQLSASNTFFTSTCDRTVVVNKKELRDLKKIARLKKLIPS